MIVVYYGVNLSLSLPFCLSSFSPSRFPSSPSLTVSQSCLAPPALALPLLFFFPPSSSSGFSISPGLAPSFSFSLGYTSLLQMFRPLTSFLPPRPSAPSLGLSLLSPVSVFIATGFCCFRLLSLFEAACRYLHRPSLRRLLSVARIVTPSTLPHAAMSAIRFCSSRATIFRPLRFPSLSLAALPRLSTLAPSCVRPPLPAHASSAPCAPGPFLRTRASENHRGE